MATDQEGIKMYFPPEDADWVRNHCAETGRTVAGLFRMLLKDYREKQPPVKAVRRRAKAAR